MIEQQFSVNEMRVISPILEAFPHYSPYEVLLAHLSSGIDNIFFLLGGSSLMGTQVITRVAEVFGVELGLLTLFDAPTVRRLSAEIEVNGEAGCSTFDGILTVLGPSRVLLRFAWSG
jgi:hypothetical protein